VCEAADLLATQAADYETALKLIDHLNEEAATQAARIAELEEQRDEWKAAQYDTVKRLGQADIENRRLHNKIERLERVAEFASGLADAVEADNPSIVVRDCINWLRAALDEGRDK